MVLNAPIWLYHITHGKNLKQILDSNGLLCCTLMDDTNKEYENIGHKSLKSIRARHKVPTELNGNLNDYVPFYFAPRSPMLYAIHKSNVENCDAKQHQILYLVSSVEEVVTKSYQYVFTDGHAIINYSKYFTDLENTNKIDWDVMQSRFWNDTSEDPDRKRNAEFLVKDKINWNSILEIGVLNKQVKDRVLEIMRGCEHIPEIVVHREWYY